MKADLTAAQKEKIMNFLRDKAEDGLIREKTKAKIACIYWKNR
jgi:hypothetical protein